MKIAVVGLGYVGVPVAAAFADAGFDVVGIDIEPAKVEAIKNGRSPLEGEEPGLAELVARAASSGRLRASGSYSECDDAEFVIVAVETPIDDVTHDPQFRALRSALSALGPHLKRGAIVSIESTVAPGTISGLVKPVLEKRSGMREGRGFHVVHCPERVTSGKLLHNLYNLDRVLGGRSPKAMRAAVAVYEKILKGTIHVTDWITAEISKTAENAYWDVQLAFANELALICEELGANAYRVRELVNTSPYRAVLVPGTGVGGHCIPKDPWLLVSRSVQMKPVLIPAAREINEFMPRRTAHLAEEGLRASGRRVKGARIAVLGLTYKEDTDDCRNSPALVVVRELRRRGADVRIHDPHARSVRGYDVLRDLDAAVRGADAVVVATAHTAYRKINWTRVGRLVRRKVLVDGRNLVDGVAFVRRGWVYRGIGKGRF